jgi:hypothetical protein
MARTKPGTDRTLQGKSRRRIWSWSVSSWSLKLGPIGVSRGLSRGVLGPSLAENRPKTENKLKYFILPIGPLPPGPESLLASLVATPGALGTERPRGEVKLGDFQLLSGET